MNYHGMSSKICSSFIVLLSFIASVAAESLGSWSSITHDLTRRNEWSQIVENSVFKLGDTKLKTATDYPIYEMDYNTYPSIDGSTVAVPLALEFARQHLSLSEDDVKEFVFFTTTHIAYENLILKRPNPASRIPSKMAFMSYNQPVDLFIGTEPSEYELLLADDNDVDLVLVPICKDAFVFIVNEQNPVSNLTLEQIRNIYNGDVTNWKEVGGDDESIRPIARNANSGSQTAMINMVMQGETIFGADDQAFIAGEMTQMLRWIGGIDSLKLTNSIGYSFLYYINELTDELNIKVLSVNGIDPNRNNIKTNAYPLVVQYYAVYRQEDQDSYVGQFVDWIISPEGQECVIQAGYIPLSLED